MSGTRIEVVEPCQEHGKVDRHWGHFPGRTKPSEVHTGGWLGDEWGWCKGGSRRTLTPGTFVLIEKVDGEWPVANREPIAEMLHEKDGPIPNDAHQLGDTELWTRVVGYRIVATPPDRE